jgi:hypothetical protein
MKQPAGVMSEEVLAEKEAIVAGGAKVAEEAATSRNSISVDGRPATSTRSLATCNRSSMDGPVASGRSLAGAVNRTSTDSRPVSATAGFGFSAHLCHSMALALWLITLAASHLSHRMRA